MNRQRIDQLAKKIWDYHHMGHRLQPADCIIVLGSHDTRVAERGAQLWLDGWAPLLLFSGGLGRLTEGLWGESEADKFAEIAMRRGVPKEKILIENESTNTGENVRFSRRLLQENGYDPQTIIAVQKPYMERRTFGTFRKQWAEPEVIVTSPQIPFDAYTNHEIPKEMLIHILVGDLQRIKLYAERGYQIAQGIPEDVWDAYEKLVGLGYTEHLIEA